MVASIAAGSVIVRLWPVETASPVLASRHIQLYDAPVAPEPVGAVRSVRFQADRVGPATAGHHVQNDVHGIQNEVGIPQLGLASANVADLPDDPPESAASAVAHSVAGDLSVSTEGEAPVPAIDIVASAEAPPADVAASAPPVAAVSPSRGIVDAPAVAVTRAVTVAGRGIMTGLKATTAILRAPF
jgi:hypothetical protein